MSLVQDRQYEPKKMGCNFPPAHLYEETLQMRVLVACEESQIVCKAFRERGHEAYSCDLQACSGGHPEWHIMHDAIEVAYTGLWDLMVAHPPCTFLSRAGQAWKTRKQSVRLDMAEYRESKATEAIEFMVKLWNAPIDRVCLENPVGLANTRWRKPSQIVHPYYFGDREMKETCFWLRRLPRLNGLITIDRFKDKPKPLGTRIGSDGKVKNKYFCAVMDSQKDAAKKKSKTFPGIAKAMAEQWG